VQRSADRLRLHVALINVHDGYAHWSKEYDANPNDLLTVESAIVKSLASELHLEPGRVALLPPITGTVADARAHDDYLVGLEYLNRRTVADINHAIAHFRDAVNISPGYAPAWNGLATAYTVLRDYDNEDLPDTYYSEALTAATKAAALDRGLGRAHAILAQLHAEHWEWQQAAQEFRIALRLDPNDATAHQWHAMYLWVTGDMQAALKEMRTAYELDPLSPIINIDLGAALQYAGDTDAAIAQFHTALGLAPGFAIPHLFLADAYRIKHDYARALQEAIAAVNLTPAPHPAIYVALLGESYAQAGKPALAKQQLAILETRAQQHHISDVVFAEFYSALGNDDRAFKLLAHGVTEYDHQMLWVVIEPGTWVQDPRYKTILARMHLPITKPTGDTNL
ncbi:MAG: tetratricopeptide repeat protein, partial [Gammaproteobacteria bacterium]